MNQSQKREVLATLIKAGRKDLARQFVGAARVPNALRRFAAWAVPFNGQLFAYTLDFREESMYPLPRDLDINKYPDAFDHLFFAFPTQQDADAFKAQRQNDFAWGVRTVTMRDVKSEGAVIVRPPKGKVLMAGQLEAGG